MIKIVIAFTFFTFSLFAQQNSIAKISPQIKSRMLKGNSYREGCPVSLGSLRYLRMQYRGFDGQTKWGEMIVHQEVAHEVVALFEQLYTMGYPIHKMQLVSDFKGSDWKSIEADNTSAFNCRNATGSKKWSKHSYGKAIDLNPIENPYISRSGRISHKASLPYRKREHTLDMRPENRAVLLLRDKATKLFRQYGWKWGGVWKNVKDYQHFSK